MKASAGEERQTDDDSGERHKMTYPHRYTWIAMPRRPRHIFLVARIKPHTDKNCITAANPRSAAISVYFDRDREIIYAALKTIGTP